MLTADWRPTAAMIQLRERAQILGEIRTFFAERDVWEVETPLLSAAATTDPNLASLSTVYAGQHYYLHTSPEFPMKRLLAAGSGAIYQLCRVFRDDERGRRHHPEFTLLEWYRPGYDENQLMGEIESLLRSLAQGRRPLGPGQRLTYQQAFQRHAGLNPHTATVVECAQLATKQGIQIADLGPDIDLWLDLLMSEVVTPQLGRDGPVFITDFPASQSALARLKPGTPVVAARFELFLAGMELANGFHELTDAAEQRRRFVADNTKRRAQGQPEMPMDERFLAALAAGLPDCAGVALGVDRLLMALLGQPCIDGVLSFPIEIS